MRNRAAACRAILAAGTLAGILPGAASALEPGSPGSLLLPDVLVNLALAVSTVLLCVFGLYAYASLARFAPYHTWIYLYLVSLTGISWAAFIATTGGSLAGVVFVVTTVIGINLIVHLLRFDRVEIPSPFAARPAAVGQG
jgi:hypothetical protein